MTNLAVALEQAGLDVMKDGLDCPDCGKQACLVYKFSTSELWYECVGVCEFDATDDEEVPYWACDVCEGEGEVQNQPCDCWVPSPIYMLSEPIEVSENWERFSTFSEASW